MHVPVKPHSKRSKPPSRSVPLWQVVTLWSFRICGGKNQCGNGTSLITTRLQHKCLARTKVCAAIQDTQIFSPASQPLPHEVQPIKRVECKPQTTQELTVTAAYWAGYGTQLSVVLLSYCEGNCMRAVPLNATAVLGHLTTCSVFSYLIYLSGKHWPLQVLVVIHPQEQAISSIQKCAFLSVMRGQQRP